MKTFGTSVSIAAPAERVWAILTDASRYPSWNPTVSAVDGHIVQGGRITVHAVISPGRAFPVTVTTLDPERRMVWRGGLPLGLFTGERIFTLTPAADAVEFSMRETFTGLLAPLIGRSIPDLQPAFNDFAAALKREAEKPG